MKTMMRACRAAVVLLALLTLLVLTPMQALAAGEEDTVDVAGNGTVTVVSVHAAGEMVSSVQVCIRINPAEGGEIGFTFDGGLAGRLTKASYRDGALNIYVAGTAPLMAAGQSQLVLGVITGGDMATVELPEDALQFVYGKRVIAQNAELTGVTKAEPEPEPTGTPAPAPVPESAARTNLISALEKAKGVDPAGYTQTSYEALQAAIGEAEAVLADPAAADAQLQEAADKLQSAMDRLVPVASADGSGPVIGDGQDDGTGAGAPEPGAGEGPEGGTPSLSAEFGAGGDVTPTVAPTAAPTTAPTAVPNAQGSAPNTGDGASAGLWLTVLCLCGLMLIIVLRRQSVRR